MMLFIIRGLPGSGKSTLAEKLAPLNSYSADDYFYQGSSYNYDKSKIGEAHRFCLSNVEQAMRERKPFIAVANTFVMRRDFKPYVKLSVEHGYFPVVLTCTHNYGSVHGVSIETMERMKRRFQY